jgi:hypothetical protein
VIVTARGSRSGSLSETAAAVATCPVLAQAASPWTDEISPVRMNSARLPAVSPSGERGEDLEEAAVETSVKAARCPRRPTLVTLGGSGRPGTGTALRGCPVGWRLRRVRAQLGGEAAARASAHARASAASSTATSAWSTAQAA